MADGVVVRPLNPEDRAAALDLWVEAWQGTYPAIDFAARRSWLESHLVELAQNGALVFVAVRNDCVAGFVTVNPSTGYIDQLVVATAHQRQGVAGSLVTQARRVSRRPIELQVNQDNHRAVAFYRKHGFAIAGTGVTQRSGAPTYRMIRNS